MILTQRSVAHRASGARTQVCRGLSGSDTHFQLSRRRTRARVLAVEPGRRAELSSVRLACSSSDAHDVIGSSHECFLLRTSR
jgi:hypothetical protein